MESKTGELFEKTFDKSATNAWSEMLQFQARLFVPCEIDILQALGLDEHCGPLLDLGCGVGAYSLYLKQRFPSLSIVAADTNEALLTEFEKEASAQNIQNVSFCRWSAGKEPHPPSIARCKAALLSLVLQHNRNPGHVLSALREGMPKKATIFIIEEDDALFLCDPPTRAFSRIVDIWNRYAIAHDSSRTMGRQVPRLATEAGLHVTDVRICPHTSVQLGVGPICRLLKMSLAMLVSSTDILMSEEADDIAREIDQYLSLYGERATIFFPKIIVRAEVM